MPNDKTRLYFLGSGAIAVPALAAVAACSEIDLVGCATQPDRPQGRNRVRAPTPVGQWCAAHGIEVAKPESANSPAFLEHLRSLAPDLILVFSYGQILSSELLQIAHVDSINIHASLLPRYRGASPIAAAILDGETETGVTFMRMVRALDAGPVYRMFNLAIPEHVTAVDLEIRLAERAAQVVCETVRQIHGGQLSPHPQNTEGVSHTYKLRKADGQIRWTDTAVRIERQTRAYDPWPGAWFNLESTDQSPRQIIIRSARVEASHAESIPPGTIVQADKHGWKISCGSDLLNIVGIIPQGKREMSAIEFIRGNPIQRNRIS